MLTSGTWFAIEPQLPKWGGPTQTIKSMSYTSFGDFITAARSSNTKTAAVNASSLMAIANSTHASIPRDGVVPAFFPGHHIYVKLDLRVGLLTSSNNEDRKKGITLLADVVEGVRNVLHEFEGGAVLEAQGPVVHGFIPGDDKSPDDPRTASLAIQAFINAHIKPRAGDDFVKSLIAYCHGQSLFVATVDPHGDNSIVSLAPAANMPAKILWAKSDDLPSGSIVEVESDGSYRTLSDVRVEQIVINRGRVVALNSSQNFSMSKIAARELTIPQPYEENSPTVEEPHESYSISIRADMDGFTNRVRQAFMHGHDAAILLAQEFHEVMVHAREFSYDAKAIHLPWAGDCFNLLIAVDDREEYQENRKRKILEILPEFQKHMAKKFPDIEWSYSCAGGPLENAQKCNTLVSRLTVGHTTLLLATGLPVERSLQGLAKEGPCAQHGVLWKGDVEILDEDLKSILKPCPGGNNHRHFAIADVKQAYQRSFFIPPRPVYEQTSHKIAPALAIPVARPYFPRVPNS